MEHLQCLHHVMSDPNCDKHWLIDSFRYALLCIPDKVHFQHTHTHTVNKKCAHVDFEKPSKN